MKDCKYWNGVPEVEQVSRWDGDRQFCLLKFRGQEASMWAVRDVMLGAFLGYSPIGIGFLDPKTSSEFAAFCQKNAGVVYDLISDYSVK